MRLAVVGMISNGHMPKTVITDLSQIEKNLATKITQADTNVIKLDECFLTITITGTTHISCHSLDWKTLYWTI